MYYISIVFIISILLPAAGFAEEYLMGTVISVDRPNGEIVVQPIEYISADERVYPPESDMPPVTVRFTNSQGKSLHIWNRRMNRLSPGRHIRMRGELDSQALVFFAKDLRGCGRRGGHDPTGVRGRLGRACDNRRPHPEGCRKRCCPEGKPYPPIPDQNLENK